MFAIHQEGGYSCVEVFFFRTGQNWGNRAYFPRAERSLDAGRGARLVPRAVLRRQAAAATDPALARDRGARAARRGAVDQGRPQGRGRDAAARREEGAGRRTRSPMRARRWAASSPRPRRRARLLDGIGHDLRPAAAPRRIEVYDNSHIQGTNAVGAMIVAGPEGFVKNQYRKFNIRRKTSRPATISP